MNIRFVLFGAVSLLANTAVFAHPDFNPGTCTVLGRQRAGHVLNLDNAEVLDFLAPALRIGTTTTTCTANLGPGSAQILNFENVHEECLLGPPGHFIAKTQVWTEIIKENGETTLICTFGPHEP